MGQKIIMTVGLPASGKTTWAKEQVKKSQSRIKRVNKDELREMLDIGEWSRENEKFILAIRDDIIINALTKGYSIIIDDTNFSSKHEESLKRIASQLHAEFEINDSFLDVPLSVCIDRDSKREKPVGNKVIVEMHNQYIKGRGVIQKDESLPKAIICDIDGTLALSTGRNIFDWSQVHTDEVHHMVARVIGLFKMEGYKILITTGRDGSCENQTKKWLKDNQIGYDEYFTRPAGNNEKDCIIKERIYRNQIVTNYNVVLVLDDRNQVVDTWRKLGLECWQVQDGSF
jgi:predicted kinase